MTCSHAEETKQVAHSSAAVSRAAASTTLIYIALVFPIHANMVPNELLIKLMKCGGLDASHTSQLDIHEKVDFSGSMLLIAIHTHTHSLGNRSTITKLLQ